MSTLDTALKQASEDLRWVGDAIARVGPAGTLSKESNEFFQMGHQLAVQLEHAKALLPVREIAINSLLTFPSQDSKKSPGLFHFNGTDVTFKVGRYLLFQNYSVTSWALYDTISKVSGILCGNDELSKNLARPAKLYKVFLQGKNNVGARVRDHLKGAYGWPIAVSYKIRNWLAHDGHYNDGQYQQGSDLFKYDSPGNAGEFEMSDVAWDIVFKNCKGDPSQTRLTPFPDVKANLATGLQACHAEADEAVAFLLSWSAGIARLQATILFRRDARGTAIFSPGITSQ
jgi:hypothetical protein